MENRVELNLSGDFLSDIRGRKLSVQAKFVGSLRERPKYMDGFACNQRGRAGLITSGGPNDKGIDYPYIEWYGERNDRVVLMPGPETIVVIDAEDEQ